MVSEADRQRGRRTGRRLALAAIFEADFGQRTAGAILERHLAESERDETAEVCTDAKGNPLPQYFQPRPSAAVNPAVKTDYGCDPGFSAASNLGPDNPVLVRDIKQRQRQIAAFDHVQISAIPADAVTASASGLDPYISPQNAAIQVDRVAAARHVSPAAVRALVQRYSQSRTLGFLGEPRVNVLNLNIALNEKYPA